MKKFKEILEAKDPEYVIQDNGKSFKLANGMSLPRYGVWKIVTAKGKSLKSKTKVKSKGKRREV